MAYSLVSPNTFALKLKIHCKVCQKKLRNMLLKIQDVHSVAIDGNLGNLVITGTVDPKVINPLTDPDIMTQLEQLSGFPGFQTVEVTRTIKLTFQGQSRNDPQKIYSMSFTNPLDSSNLGRHTTSGSTLNAFSIKLQISQHGWQSLVRGC